MVLSSQTAGEVAGVVVEGRYVPLPDVVFGDRTQCYDVVLSLRSTYNTNPRCCRVVK